MPSVHGAEPPSEILKSSGYVARVQDYAVDRVLFYGIVGGFG